MRGLSTMYRCSCEREGCLTNHSLVKYFAELDQMAITDTPEVAEKKCIQLGKPPGTKREVSDGCPRVIDLSHNYLGDAGLAALFRVLPLMQWVTTIHAPACGAGQKAVKALCDILTMRLPTVTNTTTGEEIGVPLIQIEYVDLRDNALFVAAGRELVRALETRRRIATSSTADLPSTVVLIDYSDLPPSLAQRLEMLNQIGDEDRKQKELERKRRLELEQQQLFCIKSSDGNLSQPMGEHVIYRIPEYMPRSRRQDPNAPPVTLYDSSNPQLVRLVREMNQHMEEYLVAFKCLSKQTVIATSATAEFDFAAAAAQICVELGAETLSFLPYTHAAVWFKDEVLNSSSRDREGLLEGTAAEAEAQRERALYHAEIKMNVSKLLRGIYANPYLERELVQHRGAVLATYLRQLKELFYADVVPTSPEEVDRRMELLDAMYIRVVSALTTQSLADFPSMAQFEERLQQIQMFMVEEMLVGTEVEELRRTQQMYRRELTPCRNALQWVLDPRSANLPPPLEAGGRADLSAYRCVWPLWCTQMKYLVYNKKSKRKAWNREYVPMERQHWSPTVRTNLKGDKSGQRSNSTTPRVSPAGFAYSENDEDYVEQSIVCQDTEEKIAVVDEEEDESLVPDNYRSLVMCTCHQRLANSFPELPPTAAYRPALPRPCPSCCYASLAVLPAFLRDPHVHEVLAVQEKVRDALPMELKVFFLDMILRRRGKAGYVPCIFGVGTRLRRRHHGGGADDAADGPLLPDPHPFYPDLPRVAPEKLVSILDFFALVDGKVERMNEVLSGFKEWYRLKTIESFDVVYPYLARPQFGPMTMNRTTDSSSLNGESGAGEDEEIIEGDDEEEEPSVEY